MPGLDWGTVPDWLVGVALLVVSVAAVRISRNQFRLALAPRLEMFVLGVCKLQEGADFPIQELCLHWEILLSNPGQATILVEFIETRLDGVAIPPQELWTGRSHPEIMKAPMYIGSFPWELSHADPMAVRSETLAREMKSLREDEHELTMRVTYRSGGRKRSSRVGRKFAISLLSALDRSIEPLEYDTARRIYDRTDEIPTAGQPAPRSVGVVASRSAKGSGYIEDEGGELLYADYFVWNQAKSAQQGDRVTYRIVPGLPNRKAVKIEFAPLADPTPSADDK